ncbi:polycystic kidney disease protein 1-like 2 [Carcharodon carcharias]|uniref:polycystic kidney disease protein 1-like 2 n=1 Tax=Carcharodon carcharias TaxID=13397 RepID=UPI001B7E8FD9|nr:polycystic kidney disease protein 1-like 2 [Carcharodon carcharias]
MKVEEAFTFFPFVDEAIIIQGCANLIQVASVGNIILYMSTVQPGIISVDNATQHLIGPGIHQMTIHVFNNLTLKQTSQNITIHLMELLVGLEVTLGSIILAPLNDLPVSVTILDGGPVKRGFEQSTVNVNANAAVRYSKDKEKDYKILMNSKGPRKRKHRLRRAPGGFRPFAPVQMTEDLMVNFSYAIRSAGDLIKLEQASAFLDHLTSTRNNKIFAIQVKASEVLLSLCAQLLYLQDKGDNSSERVVSAANSLFHTANHLLEAMESKPGAITSTIEMMMTIASRVIQSLEKIHTVLLAMIKEGDKPVIKQGLKVSMYLSRNRSSDLPRSTISTPGPGCARFTLPSKNALKLIVDADPVIQVKMMCFEFNPFASFGEKPILGHVGGLALLFSNNTEVAVYNLSENIEVTLFRDNVSKMFMKEYRSSGNSLTMELNVTSDEDTVVIHINSEETCSLQLFLGFQYIPSETMFQLHTMLPVLSTDGDQVCTWILTPRMLKHGEGAYYVMITPSKTSQTEVISYNVSAFTTQCLFWTGYKWSSNQCHVGLHSTPDQSHCLCNHLTFFGSTFFVMPNKLDLTQIPELFTQTSQNPVVVSLVAAIFGIYIIVLVWARIKDRSDLTKAKVTVLFDNDPLAQYRYLIRVHTGHRKGSATTAKVVIMLSGSEGDSDPHFLTDSEKPVFERGGVDEFLLTTFFPLGDLQSIRLWHDNSGSSPSWYVNRVTVLDVEAGQQWYFICNSWLAIDIDENIVDKIFLAASDVELKSFKNLFFLKTAESLTDGHIWFSVVERPTRSFFTRVQRVSCCFSLLLGSMLTNIMFWGTSPDESTQHTTLGDFSFFLQEFMIGVESAFIMFPINLGIVQIFRSIRHRPNETKTLEWHLASPKEQPDSPKVQLISPKGHLTSSNGFPGPYTKWYPTSPKRMLEMQQEAGEHQAEMSEAFSRVAREVEESVHLLSAEVEYTKSSLHCSEISYPRYAKTNEYITYSDIKKIISHISRTRMDGVSALEEEVNNTSDINQLLVLLANILQISMEQHNMSGNGDTTENPMTDLRNLRFEKRQFCLYTLLEQVQENLNQMGISKFQNPYSQIHAVDQGNNMTTELDLRLVLESAGPQKLEEINIYLPGLDNYVATSVHRSCLGPASKNSSRAPAKCSTSIFKEAALCAAAFIALFVRKVDHQHVNEETFHLASGEPNKALQTDRSSKIYQPPTVQFVEQLKEMKRKEKKMYAMIQKILVHLVFLSLLLTISYGEKNPNAFYLNRAINQTFTPSFSDIRIIDDFYTWASKLLLPNLYGSYNGFITDGYSKLLGSPRIRQLRVKKHDCPAKKTLKSIVKKCEVPYSFDEEDMSNYGEQWTNNISVQVSNLSYIWEYQPRLQKYPFWRNLALYRGSGYVADLTTDKYNASRIVKYIAESNWLDSYTRAIFVEFTVYNANVNLFCLTTLTLETNGIGAFIPSADVESIQLVQNRDITILFAAVKIAYMLFVVYYMVLQGKLLREKNWKYFKDKHNLMEVSIILCSWSAFALFLKRLAFESETLDDYVKNPQRFVSFHGLMSINSALNYVIAVLVALTTVKLWHLLHLNPKLHLFTSAMRRAWGELRGLFVILVLLLVAYSSVSYVMLGSNISSYSTFFKAVAKILYLQLGIFNYNEVLELYPTAGAIIIATSIISMTFVVLNLFLSVILVSFTDEPHSPLPPEDQEVIDLLVKKLCCFFGIQGSEKSSQQKKAD